VIDHLPPFPVDDGTLDMLMMAVDPWNNGDTTAERSALNDFLALVSALVGIDPDALADDSNENDHVVELRDPQYSHHDVIVALVHEIRRLREAST
jgi:hypothetical protein